MTTKITDKNISNLANIGVQWQAVFTGDGSTGLTAVAGRGYFIDTTSGTVTVTLPASPSAGDVVVLKDYARTWGTNNVTIASALFDGGTVSQSFSTNGQTVTLVYMDGTKGWSLINEDTTTNLGPEYITATGGTVTTSGDYKIHSFTGDGCFVVATIGNAIAGPTGSTIDFMVVAGGGGGGSSTGGGGGAGGLRTSTNSPVTTTTYPVTIGSGGAGVGPSGAALRGNQGNSSVFNSITSAGGGGGGGYSNPTPANAPGGSGGSGGGSAQFGSSPAGPDPAAGGAGNTPPVAPPQGNPGSGFSGGSAAGSGGGAGGAGIIGANPTSAGVGGVGFDATPIFGAAPQTFYLSDSPNAGTVSTGYFAGGGGGGSYFQTPGPGGLGGGGNGGLGNGPGGAGIANSGGGGGGGQDACTAAASGGSGIVLIRYKFQ